jgi:phage-related protein
MILLNATEFIMKIVEMIMQICELIADQISELTAGLVPADAVDELGILVILLLLRAGFDFTKKILEMLIIVFAIFLFIQVLPSILALF